MTREQLVQEIFSKKTYLCVGLDTDRSKLPTHLRNHPEAFFEFNKALIDATADHCVAYKINTAFYEAEGVKGWEALEKTIEYIPATHFTIADAKRGDIGNTSAQYAKAFFENMNFDAITVAPYMGEDSIKPFLDFKNKWTIVLGLTSNPGAKDFEMQYLSGENNTRELLYERVLRKVSSWGTTGNLMFVVGATREDDISSIRKIIPSHFLLVPGVGAQGGSLESISSLGLTEDCGLLINVSRAIIYASAETDFADLARQAAKNYQQEMLPFIERLMSAS